ncbi:glycosyltransferase family 2 protein [Campylobacter sp. MIT 99-7217]|uniref:GalNAc(5)-diNAcBac-PP-undecaprenol beta-1,3-glucosyltransferase n=1 Tax=Campylobacter sp. MIT 99-7217 TaxID=535091 RepID=UPI00115B5748|nr:glycosyltransferase family 2 protein [Campylobacter sp. MIT 99-7217]TQR33759.1 glycosyltransferase family 2 protein [Campylobacter sp. MIT 99-7217]
MKPFLSVLITTYNRKDLLLKAVNSVLEQDFKDLELIISDDFSNDGTKELCEGLVKKDERIKYFLNQSYKKGPNGNKNNALDKARGKFIIFLDDDDELLKGAISELIKKLNEGYSHVLANCVIRKNGILSDELSGRGLKEDQELSKKDFLMAKFEGEFLGIFEKALLENERFDENFYGNEALLWVKLYAKKSFYIHKALRIYTNNQISVTKNASNEASRVFLGYFEMAKLIEKELENDKDLAKKCAYEYKMAAYYAKLARLYKKMFFCLFKSLKIHFNKEAFILLCLCFLPNSFIKTLSKMRVSLKCKN